MKCEGKKRKTAKFRNCCRKRRQDFYNTRLTNQKQNNFKPGEISDRLRYALGLEINDIPEYIYRMRRIGFIKGYPPGWLQKWEIVGR